MSNELSETSSLCFPRDSFSAPYFDLDTFLTRYKRDYGLERLQTDLALFLKILKTSMIDLINKDYADFVNLSTNLVGLERAIGDFEKPLCEIKRDIENIQSSINCEYNTILSKINEKLSIEKRKVTLKLLMNWERSIKVTHDMLINNDKLTGDHIERIAFEFRQLQHSLSFCQQDKSTHRNEITNLSELLEKIMQEMFIKSYESQNFDRLKHILNSYALLSRSNELEQLYKQTFVKQYMDKYINESYLESNERRLDAIYDRLIEFLDINKTFLDLTNEIKCRSIGNSNPHELNFVVNSIFNYALEALLENLSIIFSPSDPNQFYKNYTISMQFLDKFEEKSHQEFKIQSNLVKNLIIYKKFTRKWPTQLYFQIRFQEIASKLELNLAETSLGESNFKFFLKSTNSLDDSLVTCWSDGVYLACLKKDFWKLNLELLSRFSNYFANKLDHIQINDDNFEFCVYLMIDSNRMCEKLPNFFDGNVAPLLRTSKIKEISLLKDIFLQSLEKFKKLSIQLSDAIVCVLVEKSFFHLKSVSDIPRLYRRTNRENPKQALNYVKQGTQVLNDFNDKWMSIIHSDINIRIIHRVIDQLCVKYYTICSELLDSIRKMEDSLKRLKKVRGESKQDAANSGASDDDKIRIQLYLDVCEFGSNLNDKLKYNGGLIYAKLFQLVDDIKQQIDI